MASFYKVVLFVFLILLLFVFFLCFYFTHSYLFSVIFYVILSFIIITTVSRIFEKSFKNSHNIFFKIFPELDLQFEKYRNKIAKLNLHRSNLLKIIENIRLGVLLINEKGNVVLSNSYITTLFNDNAEIGKNIIDCWKNYKIVSLFDKYLKENFKKTEFEEKVLKFDRISLESGQIIMIEDITKDEKYQQMKMQFFSNASHELKTPITSIVGYAETLLANENIDTIKQKEFLEHIYKNSMNLNKIINDILELAKIEHFSGYSQITANAEINDILEDLNINNLISTKPIRFIKDCHLNQVLFDKHHIEIVLNNLLDNAFFYTKEGFIKLKCYENNDFYIFEVQDSGIGIEKKEQSKIFERFYKIKSKGSGLGLAIVKHLVLLYNGDIELESKVGIGSTFRIKLLKKR